MRRRICYPDSVRGQALFASLLPLGGLAVRFFDMLADIISPEFFSSQVDWLLWCIMAGSVALLVFGADKLVGAAAKLAATLGLSKVIIGATVVSLGTTSPEAAVSVNAAFSGNGGLALGNGVGSIICDTALIFGLCCCLVRLPKDRFVLNRHGWLQFGAGLLLAGVLLVLWAISGDINNVVIPRVIGFAFLALLVLYMYLSVRWSRQHQEIIPDEARAAPQRDNGPSKMAVAIDLALIVFGLLLVVGGSELLVGSAKVICARYGVPEEVMAVTVVAFGTSLPELVTAIASIIKGHSELLVGNIIGADILNILFVIGASASAVPLEVAPKFYWLLIPVMLVVLGMLRVAIFWKGSTFRRWHGAVLLAMYAIFLILSVKFGVMGN